MASSGSASAGMPLVSDPLMSIVVKMMALYGPEVPAMEDINLARDIVEDIVALAKGADGVA